MKYRPLSVGDLRGMTYEFDEGEGLPMHSHAPGAEHITICAKGSCEVFSPEGERHWRVVLKAGEGKDLKPGPHEIRALESDTVIWNIQKHCAPVIQALQA